MLEYGVKNMELRDDFITIWSRYILGAKTDDIIIPLKQLAECGQIDAIQVWYLLKDPRETNEIIEKIVDGYTGDSFDEALAIAFRFYDRDRKEIDEIKNQVQQAIENGNDGFVEKGKQQFNATDYAQAVNCAAFLLNRKAQVTRDVLDLQRLVEICISEPFLEEIYFDEKVLKSLRVSLENMVKVLPQSSEYRFALGKNYFIGRQYEETDETSKKGVQLLTELAIRPLIHCSEKVSNDSFETTDVLDGQMRLF